MYLGSQLCCKNTLGDTISVGHECKMRGLIMVEVNCPRRRRHLHSHCTQLLCKCLRFLRFHRFRYGSQNHYRYRYHCHYLQDHFRYHCHCRYRFHCHSMDHCRYRFHCHCHCRFHFHSMDHHRLLVDRLLVDRLPSTLLQGNSYRHLPNTCSHELQQQQFSCRRKLGLLPEIKKNTQDSELHLQNMRRRFDSSTFKWLQQSNKSRVRCEDEAITAPYSTLFDKSSKSIQLMMHVT